MRRRPQATPPPASHQEPLEDRVDKAGIRQREDPAKARESREKGRQAALDADIESAAKWHGDA